MVRRFEKCVLTYVPSVAPVRNPQCCSQTLLVLWRYRSRVQDLAALTGTWLCQGPPKRFARTGTGDGSPEPSWQARILTASRRSGRQQLAAQFREFAPECLLHCLSLTLWRFMPDYRASLGKALARSKPRSRPRTRLSVASSFQTASLRQTYTSSTTRAPRPSRPRPVRPVASSPGTSSTPAAAGFGGRHTPH